MDKTTLKQILDVQQLILSKLDGIEKTNKEHSATIQTLIQNTKTLRTDLDGVITSQSLISEEFEEQKKNIKGLNNEIKTLKQKNTSLKTEYMNLNRSFTDINDKLRKGQGALNDLEQYGRRNMVDIGGIPRKKDEDTDDIVFKIAKKLDMTVKKDDIEISHRTSANKDAPIIVKFISRRTRNDFFVKRKQLRDVKVNELDIGLPLCDGKVYVNESLTALNGSIFKNSRQRLKPFCKYIWTNNGTTFVKQHDDSKKIIIKNMENISDIEQRFKLESADNLNNSIIQNENSQNEF